MTTDLRPAVPRDAPPAETISFEEAMARYEGAWLLLRVVDEDRDRSPSAVQVLARGTSEQDAWNALARLRPRKEQPDAPYYVLQAYRRIRTGDEMREALRKAADEGAPGAWREWSPGHPDVSASPWLVDHCPRSRSAGRGGLSVSAPTGQRRTGTDKPEV